MTAYFRFLLAFLFLQNTVFAQNKAIPIEPVKWAFAAKNVLEGEYNVTLTATIDKDWCVYSQFLKGDEGPVPTAIVFVPEADFQPVGNTKEEGHRKEIEDPVFMMKVVKFEDTVVFTQRVRVGKKQKTVRGTVTFMTCDGSVCLPPRDVPFEIALK